MLFPYIGEKITMLTVLWSREALEVVILTGLNASTDHKTASMMIIASMWGEIIMPPWDIISYFQYNTLALMSYYTPAQQSFFWVYWFHSVRSSVRPSIRPASRVRSVAPTGLVGSISYLYILSSNFRRCVAIFLKLLNWCSFHILKQSSPCLLSYGHERHWRLSYWQASMPPLTVRQPAWWSLLQCGERSLCHHET